MAFTKTWTSTATAYGTGTNWQYISLRNSAFAWTASGSGTNEYYVRTAANGNPGFAATPPTSNGVYINGSAATKATLGSLAAGNWGYGDNDTLGYSTVYVRLSGGGDPDAQLADHVYFYQIPQAAENVIIPANAGSISSDLDQSAVAINGFTVEKYSSNIGVGTVYPATYLRIDPDAFTFDAINGASYIDIGSAAIPVVVLSTGSAIDGYRGLYLRGSAISTADIRGGSVGIAYLGGESSTVTTLRVLGRSTSVILGSGCALTTLDMYDGEVRVRCSAGVTTINQYGGRVILEGACAATTVNQRGGTFVWNSSGTITTVNGYSGTFDEMQSGTSRTMTNMNAYDEGWSYLYNIEAVTHTNKPTLQKSMRVNFTSAV